MKWCPQCRSVHEVSYRPEPLLDGYLLGTIHGYPDLFCEVAAAWYPEVVNREEERRAVYWEASTRIQSQTTPGTYHGHCRNCGKVLHLPYEPNGFETCCNSEDTWNR